MNYLIPEELTAYIKSEVFPELGIGEEKFNIIELKGGLISRVFKVSIGEKDLIIKCTLNSYKDYGKNPYAKDIFPKDRLAFESKALELFNKLVPNIEVPRVYFYDPKHRILVMSNVCGENGVLMRDIINKKIDLRTASKLGEIAALICNKTISVVPPLRGDRRERAFKKAKFSTQFAPPIFSKIPRTEREKMLPVLQEQMRIALNSNCVLCHGDYHFRNIIQSNRKLALLDLEEAHVGDPAYDIGTLIGHYLLVGEIFSQVSEKAFEAAIVSRDSFFRNLEIAKDPKEIERRMLLYAATMGIKGIDGYYLFERNVGKKTKERIRRHMAYLIFHTDKDFSECLNKFT